MSKQVDIAVMATSLSGGIGRNKLNLIRAFCQLGYRVALLIEKPGGPFYEQLPAEVQTYRLPSTHVIGGVLPLAILLRKIKPKVLLPNVVRLTLLSLRARALACSATKVFACVHNTYNIKDSNMDPRKLEKRRRKVAAYYPKCDGIICVSAGAKDGLELYAGVPLPNAQAIHNPMVTDDLYKLKDEVVDHPWLQGGEQVILNVGRYSIAKNLPLLMEAYDDLRQKYDAKLLLVTTNFEKVRALADESPFAKDIDIIGFQVNPFKYMARADLYVLCSNFEGLPGVLIEALACGTPVVSTDCPSGPVEILEGGKLGPLVPMNDATALSEAMLQQLKSPRVSAEVGRASVEGRFSNITIARKYAACFGISEPD